MRTTLTLEDDVARRLQAEARRTGVPFKTVVNQHLRRSLAQRTPRRDKRRFKIEPRELGGPVSGVSYDAIPALLDAIEGEFHQ